MPCLDPDRRGESVRSPTTDQSPGKHGHQSPSVKRHQPGRYSKAFAPYPRPSLLAAIRQKASTTLQEALKWPHAQLSKWAFVKKPEDEVKKEEAQILESSVLQLPALIPSPPPSEDGALLRAVGVVEVRPITEAVSSQPSFQTLPSEHDMSVAVAEASPVFKATSCQFPLPGPSANQERTIVEPAAEKTHSLIGSTGKCKILRPS